jgi:site-specific recombinase XerD
VAAATTTSATSVGDVTALAASFRRALRARNRSPRTVRTYLEAVDGLARFLAERGMPTQVAAIRREHVEAYVESLLDRWTAATALNRYASLKQFFRFLVEDGEIIESPMTNYPPPKVEERPPPVLTDEQLVSLLKVTEGNTFERRRDHAILRVFIDTGARVSEIAGLRLTGETSLDLDAGLVTVMGKGARVRVLPIGVKSVRAIDRYLRSRAQHPLAAGDSWLWLGTKGRMTDSGIRQMVERRAREAEIDGKVTPHVFRHTFAHRWLAGGQDRGNLEQIAGWTSPTMSRRYAKIAAAERARDAHREFKPGDRL